STYTGAAQLNSVAGVSGAVSANPMFVEGPLGAYYLDPTSPAVNAGNRSAVLAELNQYTTNPAFPVIFDTGNVDLGYHYNPADMQRQFTLSVAVLDNQGNIRGTVALTPEGDLPGTYYYGQIVEMTAMPYSEYVITGWSGGTVNDQSAAMANKVIMTRDKDITVHARRRQTYFVGLASGLPSLQDAIDLAQSGDTIIVNPGVYNAPVSTPGEGAFIVAFRQINLDGKDLRISGIKPDDEDTVRNTVFSQYVFNLFNVTEKTVIEGITITTRHGSYIGQTGFGGRFGAMTIYNGNPVLRNVIFSENSTSGWTGDRELDCPDAMDGSNGGNVLGSAVVVIESSPYFVNCQFEDNVITGGDGQNGAGGCNAHPEGGDGGWPGRAYGGAVYVAFSSKPVFENCTFTGNQAIGGVAGNGGDGIVVDNTSYRGGRGGAFLFPDSIENDRDNYWWWWDGWELGDKYAFYSPFFGRYDWSVWSKWFGWDQWNSWQEFFASAEFQQADSTSPKIDGYEEYWKYSAFGGAVYVGYLSEATFVGCTFEGNQTQGGLSGIGGRSGDGEYPTPDRQLNLPNAGGAVYAAYESKLIFDNCTFADNLADTSVVDLPLALEVSFGGAVAYEFDCEVVFKNTILEGNRAAVGGAVYGRDSRIEIADCNAFDNEAYLGGGLYFDYGSASLTHTLLHNNNAKVPTIEITPPDDDDDDQVVPPTPIASDSMLGQGGGLFAAGGVLDVKHTAFFRNLAVVSGGGVYLGGILDEPANLFNCLFAENLAGRDGAGASVNWESLASFGNCTFADNRDHGALGFTLRGGGLYTGHGAAVDVINSIFWGNKAEQGRGDQIRVGAGFELDPRPSTLNISWSNVQAFGSAAAISVAGDSIYNVGDGMLGADPAIHNPLFTAPPDIEPQEVYRRYYLDIGSPAIDAGYETAAFWGLNEFTTNIFGARDRGEVDMGYHYRIVSKAPCSFADLILSGQIDLADFAEFASAWLYHEQYDPCGEGNNWCNGGDLNFDRRVDIDDLLSFTACWLERDEEAPRPNPSLWAIEPNAVPGTFDTVNMMIAETHDDWWPDEYLEFEFECVDFPQFSSGWQSDPFYQVSGLTPGFTYAFRTRARDGSGNETEFSVVNPAMDRGIVTPGSNTEIPQAEFEVLPVVSGPLAISMTARAYSSFPGIASLPSGFAIRYQFAETISTTPTPTVSGFESLNRAQTRQNLSPATLGLIYTYQVRMVLVNLDTGAEITAGEWSEPAAVVLAEVDVTPPTPDPAAFTELSPFQQSVAGNFYQVMVAVEAEDDSGVEYRFRAYQSETSSTVVFDSGWRNVDNVAELPPFPDGTPQAGLPHQYWQPVTTKNLFYWWTVQYRDRSPMQNAGQPSPRKRVTNTLP
ncbi:MAG TPA: hypothetical protein ENN97_00920, partial [Phycisphaerales bacterium]|nr:hypothetical protein [Phycisphaerales bacterium]